MAPLRRLDLRDSTQRWSVRRSFPDVSRTSHRSERPRGAARPPGARASRRRTHEPSAALRDTLLPKLISGELRVKDANRIVRGALLMADANLTQAEGDALIALAKHRVDMTEWDYPDLGGVISVPLFSADRRENFLLDVRRGRIDLAKGTYQNRGRQVVVAGEARLRWSAPPESGRGGDRLAASPSLSGRRRLADRARPRHRAGMRAAERRDYRRGRAGAAAARCAGAAQPGAARRGAGGRLPQADAARRAPELIAAQPRAAPPAGGWRDGRVPHADGGIRGAQARVIDFDDPAGNDWLAVNQFSVVENKHSRGRTCAVRERPAAGGAGAQERRRRERHDLERLPAAPDLQGGGAVALRDERGARRLRRGGGARRHAQRRARVVQALADHRGRGAGRRAPAGAAGGDRGPLRAAALPRSGARLHRVRGRRRPHRQEDGRLPPVPRGAGGGGRDAARRGAAPRGRSGGRGRGPLRGGSQAGRQARRPARGRGLAHAGLGQEPDDGVLRRPHHPRAGDGEPDPRRAHRPQRPRRPALRHLLALPGPAAPAAGAGGEPRASARAAQRGGGRGGVHHHPQVLPRGEGRPAPDALRAPQHRGDRRRGAPQPVRLHRRLRAPHARRAAARLVHRLHRHADRAAGRQHARGLRRLHQRLRHPARRAGRRHGADLLREPAGQARARRGRAAEDRPGVRGGDRGRGGRAQGEAQDQVGAARGGGRRREAPGAGRAGHRRALREAARGDGRQGDDRLHEPAHLRGAVSRDREAAAALGRARRTSAARSRS